MSDLEPQQVIDILIEAGEVWPEGASYEQAKALAERILADRQTSKDGLQEIIDMIQQRP